MTDRRDDLLDESILRRALRLEPDERAPLFDVAAIAAAARPRTRLALVSALVAIAIGVAGAVTVWSAAIVTSNRASKRPRVAKSVCAPAGTLVRVYAPSMPVVASGPPAGRAASVTTAP